MASDPYVLC